MATKKATTAKATKKTVTAKAQKPSADTAPLADYERTLNLQRWLSGIYGVQAVALLILGNAYEITVSRTFLALDTLSSSSEQLVYSPAVRQLFDVNILHMIAGTMFILAVLQLLAVTVFRDKYLHSLEVRTFVLRSITFGVGVTATVWTVALLSGIRDISVLGLLAVCVSAAMVSFYLYQQRSARKATTLLGWFAGIAAAVVLAAAPIGAFIYDGAFPVYLYGIYGALVVYLAAITVLVIRSEKRGGNQRARLRAERSLGIALLGLQSLVVWQVFLGVLS